MTIHTKNFSKPQLKHMLHNHEFWINPLVYGGLPFSNKICVMQNLHGPV